jgi:hypothetical protein
MAGILLGAIVVASIILRAVLSHRVVGPWIFVDELIYSELGRSAFQGFSIRGVPVSGYGNLYPFVIAPVFALVTDLVSAYNVVKIFNSTVMSLTAIPVYFIARTLMGRRWALVAAALSVIVPSMAYTGMVMTENAFYPAFALTMLLIVRTLHRPTIIRQVLAFAGVFLCYEVRPQGAIIAPALIASVILIVVLDAVFADTGERLRQLGKGVLQFLPTWLILAAATLAMAIIAQSRGTGFSSLLGAYSITAEDRTRYQAKPVIAWFLLHIAEMDLWLCILPFAALLVLIGIALTRTGERSVRVFACAAVPIMLLMSAVVSAFVVFANVARIEERNLFYIGFLALIAFCWWGSTGFERRQPRWFIVTLVVAAFLPVTLPFEWLLSNSAVSDTFGVFLPYAIQSRLMDASFTPFIVGLGAVLAICALLITTPKRIYLPVVVVAGFLLLTGAAVDRRTDKAAAAARAISVPQNWVDQAVGADADVSVVAVGGSDPMRVWQAEFFNRSLGPVLTLFAPLAGGLPDTVVNVRPDGTLTNRDDVPIGSAYVLTDSLTGLAGPVIARDERFGMTLIKTGDPIVVKETVSGVYNDGWSGADITYTRYACSGGRVQMRVNSNHGIHAGPVTVTPFDGDVAMPSTQVSETPAPTTIMVPLTANSGMCQIRFHVDPLVSPADAIGTTDTRPLGLKILGFSYQSPK